MVGGGIDSIAFCWVGGSGLVYSHAIIIVYDWTRLASEVIKKEDNLNRRGERELGHISQTTSTIASYGGSIR